MTPSLARRRRIRFAGLLFLTVIPLAACSSGPKPIDSDAFSGWMHRVQHRWAGQPGEIGNGAGVDDATSRLSFGLADSHEDARIRVAITCQGNGTVPIAVWGGEATDRAHPGPELARRDIACGHDEDLYVETSDDWITIGPTSGDSGVGWFAAAYSQDQADAQTGTDGR